ncbi:MAG: protocatechuate 3,4-dioxygenase subunit alpha [Candidatus Limnocylindria bacterium]
MPEGRDRVPTPSQTVGPFFGFALPFPGDASATAGATSATSLQIEGRVFDGGGAAVPDAILEVWHADTFARCATDAEGRYQVMVPRPRGVPGPNGSTQAPHLEVSVFARGLLRQLATRIYLPDEAAANAADPMLADIDPTRRATLVARREGDHLRFDIHLQGAGETVFFAL